MKNTVSFLMALQNVLAVAGLGCNDVLELFDSILAFLSVIWDYIQQLIMCRSFIMDDNISFSQQQRPNSHCLTSLLTTALDDRHSRWDLPPSPCSVWVITSGWAADFPVLRRSLFQAWLESSAVRYGMAGWEVFAVSAELANVGLPIKALPPRSQESAAAEQRNLLFHELLFSSVPEVFSTDPTVLLGPANQRLRDIFPLHVVDKLACLHHLRPRPRQILQTLISRAAKLCGAHIVNAQLNET